jgi:ribosome production factor 2
MSDLKRRQGKTTQSRRALKKYESKVFENDKSILFLRGASTSSVVVDAMNDLATITAPHNKKLKKRNAFHAFEGRQHLEFLGHKNDCSLFCFGSDSKKRPNNLVLGRMFDFHMLDMLELGVVAMDRVDMSGVKGQTIGSIGGKAFFVFEGQEFESEPFFVRLKNFVLDFFRGSNDIEISLEGADRVVFISLRSNNGEDAVIAPSENCIGTKPQEERGNTVLCFRHYAVSKTQSAVGTVSNTKHVKLVDVGPNFDFEVRRVCWAPQAEFKQACKVPKEALAHMKGDHENVRGDQMGNLRGQLHLGKQDVADLNLRRFKAHKKQGRVDQSGDDVERPKRRRPVEDDAVNPDTDI